VGASAITHRYVEMPGRVAVNGLARRVWARP
jgi:hypothetical protein